MLIKRESKRHPVMVSERSIVVVHNNAYFFKCEGEMQFSFNIDSV